MSQSIENPILLDHSGPNGHWSECGCDLCEPEYPVGFYECTCGYCDITDAFNAVNFCEYRHDAICDCGYLHYDCLKYPHDRPPYGEPWIAERCDCFVCTYDPHIYVCKSGCPICSHDLFVEHMRERYFGQNDNPAIVETRETEMYKYEIQQWKSPIGFWVAAIPKSMPYEPVIELYALDILDAKNCICEMIASEPVVQPKRRWCDHY